MLRGIQDWLSHKWRARGNRSPAGSLLFEPLEPRVLCSADALGTGLSTSSGASGGEAAVHVTAAQEQVIFRDDFDGATLDMTRWMLPVWQSPTDGTYLGRTQLRVAQNAAPPGVSGGVLHLQLDTYNPTALVPGDSFYGQEIISRTTFSRGEGLALETRARVVPPAPGGIVYAAFLYATIPGENTHDEIDFELLTNEIQSGANCIQTNVYDREPLGAGTPQFASVPGGDLTQYHTYRTEWLADQVRWYVDGTLIRTETIKVPEGSMPVYFNTWVPAADWKEAYNAALQPAASAAANQTFFFDVDYVTVSSFGTVTNTKPNTPTGLSPAEGATDVSLTPVLEASDFSDPDAGDVHSATRWQVDDNADFSSPVWDYEDTDSDKTAATVAAGVLSSSTTYNWRVRYQDSRGAWSEWSLPRSFTTGSSLRPIYRFWSAAYSRHFYTISEAERDKLINQYAPVWSYEGPAYRAFADGAQPNTAPVYRFWSGTLNTHFYTMSAGERDKLITSFAQVWTYEGIAFHAYPAGLQPQDAQAVYRFWSGTWSRHFYTASQAERDKLINLYPSVWTYERIAWYACGM